MKKPASGTGYEYSKDGGKTWQDSNVFSNLQPNTEYSVTVRQKETEEERAGQAADPVKVTTDRANQSAPSGLTATNASGPDAEDGAINGVTALMEYAAVGGTTWTPVTGNKITGLSAGSYQVRYAETDDKNASPAVTVTVGIANAGVTTEIYAVKQNPDGVWSDNGELQDTLNDSTVYKAAELFENFHLTAYSAGDYAEEEHARIAADAGDNIPLNGTGGKLYLYFARDSFEIVFYEDSEGTQEWKRESALYEAPLTEYEDLTLDNDAYRMFAGWSLEPGLIEYKDNEDKVIDWNAQTMPNETLKVYPVWVDNQLNIRLDLGAYDSRNDKWWYTDHSQNYDRNTPANMDEAQSRHFWVSIGEAIDMALMNQATRSGYSLEGWYTQSGVRWNEDYRADPEFCDRTEDGSIDFREDTAYRNWTYSITLTAKWTADANQVLYALNGGSGEISDNGSYLIGDPVTVSDTEPAPPANQRFVGWLDRNGHLYKSGTSFLFVDKSLLEARDGAEYIVLTAQYEPEPKEDDVTITFDTDGGSLVSSISQKPGTSVDYPTDPLKSGYDFAGWSQDIPTLMPDADLTVKALWTPRSYRITFNAGDGVFNDTGEKVKEIFTNYGEAVEAPDAPELAGYEFAGWNPELPALMPGENLTVSAQWSVKTYSLHFDADNGSAVQDITGIYGSRITPPDDPTREGYTFDGWEPEIPAYMPDAELTFTAQWKENQAAPDSAPEADDELSTPSSVTIATTEAGQEYSIDGGRTWIKPDANGQVTFENLLPNTEYKVISRMAGTDDKEPSEPSAATKITTPKKEQTAPEKLSVRVDGNSVIVENAEAGQEYSIDGGQTWVKPDENGQVKFENLTPGAEYEFVSRMEETERQNASPVSEGVTVTVGAAASDEKPDAPKKSDIERTADSITVKKPAPGTGYEYSIDGGETWQDDNAFTGLTPGEEYAVTVRKAATGTTEAGHASDPITVTTKETNDDEPGKPGKDSGKDAVVKKGCYVATSVYGSYDCPEVWTLRRFRDETLAATWYGRLFIRIYYALSPTAVKWFGDSGWFQNFFRDRLDKLVADLQADGFASTPYDDLDW